MIVLRGCRPLPFCSLQNQIYLCSTGWHRYRNKNGKFEEGGGGFGGACVYSRGLKI